MATECTDLSYNFNDDSLMSMNYLYDDLVEKESLIHQASKGKTNLTCRYCKMKFIYDCHLFNHLDKFHGINKMNAEQQIASDEQSIAGLQFQGHSNDPIIINDDDYEDDDNDINEIAINRLSHPCYNKAIINSAHLERHVSEFTDVKNYNCKNCRKTFKNYSNYRKHKWLHRQSGIQCPECYRYFKSEKTLKSHSILHSTQVAICCPICRRTLKNLSGFKIHLKKLHKELAKIKVEQILEQVLHHKQDEHLDKRPFDSQELITEGVQDRRKSFNPINSKVSSPFILENEPSQIVLDDDDGDEPVDKTNGHSDNCYQQQVIQVNKDADIIQLKIRKRVIDSCHDQRGATIVVNDDEIDCMMSTEQPRNIPGIGTNPIDQVEQIAQEISRTISTPILKTAPDHHSRRQIYSINSENVETACNDASADTGTVKKPSIATPSSSSCMVDKQDLNGQLQLNQEYQDCQAMMGDWEMKTESADEIPQYSTNIPKQSNDNDGHSIMECVSNQSSTITETTSQHSKSAGDSSSTELQLTGTESDTDIENRDTDSVLHISWSWIYDNQSQFLGIAGKETIDLMVFDDSD